MVLASNEWLNNSEDDQKTTLPTSSSAESTNNANENITPVSTNTNTVITTASTTSTLTPSASSSTSTVQSSERVISNEETHFADKLSTNDNSFVSLEDDVSQSSSTSLSAAYAAAVVAATQENANEENADTEIEDVTNHDIADEYQEILDIIRSQNIHMMNHPANESLIDETSTQCNENNNVHNTLNANETDFFTKLEGDNSNNLLVSNSNISELDSPLLAMNSCGRFNKAIVQPQSINTQNSSCILQSSFSTNSSFNMPQSVKQLASALNGLENEPLDTRGSVNTAIVTGQQHLPPSQFDSHLLQITNNETEGFSQARIILLCEANSHPFQTRSIQLTPNIQCKVGRLIAKSKACESNAIFDCKVLSRNHAVLWYSDDGKFWVKDTKSSNGTFINENKLGKEAVELHFGDIVKFGVDVLENTRKEIHGCIIACVKLYLPDGREAISIENLSQKSKYSGEGRISYEELYRLNLYMQEAAQREKILKSKLFNIQNILDATRKNSALCWQSLIAEDQLLHRIQSLEKKLQLVEKNIPENVLRNEVVKLLEDKNTYQNTAKEALRKVYQERSDALQMLGKMESAYSTSEHECKILREQVMQTKQSLQEVNSRLLLLDTEYNNYREETLRQQQEAKQNEEKHIKELMNKIEQRDKECEGLQRKISELLIQRADIVDEEERLQTQAIEKLDAAIADMDVGDDDDDDDEDIEENDNFDIIEEKVGDNSTKVTKSSRKAILYGNEIINGNKETQPYEKIVVSNVENNKECQNLMGSKENVVKESTVMKWLQNSDLNKKEDSIDIMKAICNESDSSEDEDNNLANDDMCPNSCAGAGANINHCINFENMIQNVLDNLIKMELEMSSVMEEKSNVITSLNDELDSKDIVENNSNSQEKTNKNIHNCLLLRQMVNMLQEAYKELNEKISSQKVTNHNKSLLKNEEKLTNLIDNKQFKKLETQDTLKALPEIDELLETPDDDDEVDNDGDEEDDSSVATARLSTCSRSTVRDIKSVENLNTDKQLVYEKQMLEYQKEINEMVDKMQKVEQDSQNTLEIMKFQCDSLNNKVKLLTEIIDNLQEENNKLKNSVNDTIPLSKYNQALLNANDTESQINSCLVHAIPETDDSSTASLSIEQKQFELELKSEFDSNPDSNLIQREEELITYKELLERQELDNIELRNQIAELQLKRNNNFKELLVNQILPYGVIAAAILIYFLSKFF